MKHIYKILLPILVSAGLWLTACRPADYSQVTDEDIQGLKDYVLASYYMWKADAGVSRATVPVHTDPTTFVNGSKADYPEIGQDTTWTVEDQGSNIYKITSTTTYPGNNAITKTTEVYYVKNGSPGDSDTPDAEWTNDDPVVEPDGTVNNRYRETFETVFKDDGVRYEVIDRDTSENDWNGVQWAAFDVNGSLEFPDTAFTPIDDSTDASPALYSSKVDYQQGVYKRFAFWSVPIKVIIGTRYYTEHDSGDPDNPYKTSVAYERTMERNEKLDGGIVQDLKAALFDPELNASNATLAETVIRYSIDEFGEKTIRQKTYIVNDFGDDFLLTADSGDGSDPTVSPAP